MIRVLYYLFRIAKENSIVLSLGLANLGVLIYLFWKLFTNHLSHINEAITANGKKIDKVDKDVRKLGERVSKVEGKLEK